jgi:hypothetical protein
MMNFKKAIGIGVVFSFVLFSTIVRTSDAYGADVNVDVKIKKGDGKVSKNNGIVVKNSTNVTFSGNTTITNGQKGTDGVSSLKSFGVGVVATLVTAASTGFLIWICCVR